MTSTSTGLVLVADSFEEETAIACVRALRDAGMAVTLVGLKAGPVTGSRGITVQADLSLEQVALADIPSLIVLPGGRRSAAAVLADPRVHRLAKATVATGGQVAVLSTAVEAAERLLQVPLIPQGELPVQEFIGGLLKRKET